MTDAPGRTEIQAGSALFRVGRGCDSIMGSGWSVSCVWEWAVAGGAFAMGDAACELTVIPASTSSRMPWAFFSSPERAQINVADQARLDDGMVAR